MNFKTQARQNQLIEKITAQHLVVGIDIAQQTHVARAVNFRGIVVGNPLSFSNDEEGFNSLLRWIQLLQTAHTFTAAIVGMEPTGHYWFNLSKWLSNRQFEVVLVNPHDQSSKHLYRLGNCGKINVIIERRRCLMKRNIIKSRAQFIKGKAYI
ncbi:hypothetical protein ASG81_25090 [Paenibacillus sp. Soil522]|nr:hypothetical protein ASG81_25090 [Paenibacillus sp. Soil522]